MDKEQVRSLFAHLASGDGGGFFDQVADDVDWIVEGTHPLAGRYKSKQAFRAGTFEKLAKVLPNGAELAVDNILVDGDWGAVELHSHATALDGLRFDNSYCWVGRFSAGKRVEVRADLESWLVGELFRRNPI